MECKLNNWLIVTEVDVTRFVFSLQDNRCFGLVLQVAWIPSSCGSVEMTEGYYATNYDLIVLIELRDNASQSSAQNLNLTTLPV